MIIGLGSDIVNIDRVAKLLEKPGDKFKARTFTKPEIDAASRYAASNSKAIHAHYAKRFAAKEAFAKAAGTGFGKSLSFTDITIENDEAGKPVIILSQKAQKLLKKLSASFPLQSNKDIKCHISLSDEYPYALAVVVVEG